MQSKDKPRYKIELKIDKTIYKSEGQTIVSALKKIKPKKLPLKGYFRLRYGKRKAEKLLPIWFMRKLFYGRSDLMLQCMAKNLTLLLK